MSKLSSWWNKTVAKWKRSLQKRLDKILGIDRDKEAVEKFEYPEPPSGGSDEFLSKPGVPHGKKYWETNGGKLAIHVPAGFGHHNVKGVYLSLRPDGKAVYESVKKWYYVPQNGKRMLARWGKTGPEYPKPIYMVVVMLKDDLRCVWEIPDAGVRYKTTDRTKMKVYK